ncbi:hypothetical protein FKP32DRAFT_1675928 [Trametes sanguinea]|nr:hypothetical protein FKP32DRAFT_1675928 [Trametes sanguinea]
MHAPLVRVLLLVADTACMNYGMRPPRPPPPSQEQQKFFRRDALSGNYRFDVKLTTAWRVAAGTLALLEAATILAKELPARYSSELPFLSMIFPCKAALNLRITPTFLIGSVLAIAGGLIRVSCHHALGRFFTWQLSLRRMGLITIGIPLALLSPGSYFVETGLASSWLNRGIAGAAVLYMAFITTRLFSRVPKEDEVLSTHFGEEWRAWAKKTPYKLVPFIY